MASPLNFNATAAAATHPLTVDTSDAPYAYVELVPTHPSTGVWVRGDGGVAAIGGEGSVYVAPRGFYKFRYPVGGEVSVIAELADTVIVSCILLTAAEV